MDKKEFQEKRCVLYDKIRKLEQEYLQSNSALKNGTRVKITTPLPHGVLVERGVIDGYEICLDLVVRPIVKKIKNDGTVSQFILHLRYNSVVEPV